MLKINLTPDEQAALRDLSYHERRNEGAQAAVLIRDALEERGLLPADTSTPAPSATSVQQAQHGR
jgi:hypothetical protein